MVMSREPTDPAMRVVQLEPAQPRSWAREWGPTLTLVVTLLGGGVLVFRLIAWPWETKAEAAAAHTQLQAGIDTIRDEQRARDAAASGKLDAILERLPKPKKGRTP